MILQFEIDAQHVDMRLDEFFYLHGISKKLVKDSRNHGEILVNGEKQYLCYKTVLGDNVAIVFPKETSTVIPVDIPLKVVYEDDYLMIIDKQPNLACIPVKKYLTESLGNAIMYYYKVNHIESAIHLVNRLDKETSGLMMIAKSRYVHDAFSHDIKQVKRVYHALVKGNPGQGTVNAPIDHAEGHGTKREVKEGGKEAITHYRTIKTTGEYSLVECKLETGRTHQIRVHMAYLGCPLVGDPLYGEGEGFYLDSVEIAFRHPITQQCMTLKKVFNDVRIKKIKS